MEKVSLTGADFAKYMAETEPKQKVKSAALFLQDMIDDLGVIRPVNHAFLPWAKTHQVFHLRPGEVTVWAGVNGQGKSLITGQVALSLAAQDQRVCIASFEMKPRKTLERMLRQWSGQQAPAEHELSDPEVMAVFKDLYEQFQSFGEKRIWLYDQQGTVKTQNLLAVLRYCAHELGMHHFFVDSLMKCVADEDDYNGQKRFVDEMTAIARDTGMHIHIVHHLKKLSEESKRPDKMDVKGSGSVIDQVDNLMLFWRNKPKEKLLASGKLAPETDPDAMIFCEKQRHGEWEGQVALWYHKESQQYVPTPNAAPLNFFNFPHGDYAGFTS